MKLVVGLGNPGKKYENNRHNVGWLIVDALASQISNFQTNKKLMAEICHLKPAGILLAKPITMVNSSGEAVAKLVNYYKVKPAELWVIHDDLDIKIGQYKIQKGKGPKIHKGLNSIYEKLGTLRRQGYEGQVSNFWHVRVGIENRKKKFSILNFQYPKKIPGERYVLQNFTGKEVEILNPVIDNIVADLINQFRPEDDQPRVETN